MIIYIYSMLCQLVDTLYGRLFGSRLQRPYIPQTVTGAPAAGAVR